MNRLVSRSDSSLKSGQPDECPVLFSDASDFRHCVHHHSNKFEGPALDRKVGRQRYQSCNHPGRPRE